MIYTTAQTFHCGLKVLKSFPNLQRAARLLGHHDSLMHVLNTMLRHLHSLPHHERDASTCESLLISSKIFCLQLQNTPWQTEGTTSQHPMIKTKRTVVFQTSPHSWCWVTGLVTGDMLSCRVTLMLPPAFFWAWCVIFAKCGSTKGAAAHNTHTHTSVLWD